jgi:hypothetical protein
MKKRLNLFIRIILPSIFGFAAFFSPFGLINWTPSPPFNPVIKISGIEELIKLFEKWQNLILESIEILRTTSINYNHLAVVFPSCTENILIDRNRDFPWSEQKPYPKSVF